MVLKDKMDYSEYGGAALFGLKAPVIKAHGSSNDQSIFSAIRQTREMVAKRSYSYYFKRNGERATPIRGGFEMGKLAFLFPGQGSQAVGMGKQLAENNKEVANVFAKADEVLQDSLSEVIFEGPQEKLTLTTNAQPALLTTSFAILTALKEYDITPDFVAGHSLGEYSALVAAGALTFEDAVYAVRETWGIYGRSCSWRRRCNGSYFRC